MSGGFHHRADHNWLILILGIAFAFALPRMLDAPRTAALARLVDACHVAATSSGTAAIDSAALAGFANGLRFERGRFVVAGEPYDPAQATAWRIDANTDLVRGRLGPRIYRFQSQGKAVLLALVALVVAGLSVRWATVSSRGRAAAKRALIVLAVLVLNPCLLLPLHLAGSGEIIAFEDGEVTRTRHWFGHDFAPVAAGRLRAVATWRTQVWAVLEKDGVLDTERLVVLDAPDPRLDATLLEAAAH